MSQPYGSGAAGFGLVSVVLLASFAALVAAATWVARSERRFRRLQARALGGRLVSLACDQVNAWGRALARRLPARGAAGVALVIGAAGVAALAAGFTEVLEDVLEGDGIAGIDQPAAGWLATHRDLWLTVALRLVTAAGGPFPLAVVAALSCAAAGWRSRSWLPVVLALAGAGGIALMIVTAKALVNRERPPSPFAVIAADGYSFPSGHATGTAAIALLSAWMLTRWLITSWGGRVVVWTVAIGSAVLIGFSRVYLGVHYVSDVVAGWLLGMTWAGIVVLVGSWWDNTRRVGGGAEYR